MHELPTVSAVGPGTSSADGIGTPAIDSVPLKFVCTIAPTVNGWPATGTIREEVPMPPLKPRATVPAPAPTAPSATGPAAADASASSTWATPSGRVRMSERKPSFVSPTTGFSVVVDSWPGRASMWPSRASATR